GPTSERGRNGLGAIDRGTEAHRLSSPCSRHPVQSAEFISRCLERHSMRRSRTFDRVEDPGERLVRDSPLRHLRRSLIIGGRVLAVAILAVVVVMAVN